MSALGDLEHFGRYGRFRAAVCEPGERRYETWCECRAEEAAGETNDGAGGEDSADAGFAVIAGDQTDEHSAGVDFAAVDEYANRAVGVFEVGIDGVGGEVDPLANVAVAEEAVVLFVGVAVDDGVFDLGRRLCRPGQCWTCGPIAALG